MRPCIAAGIPEIELPKVEPFLMDELSLSLSTGPKGYKITLKDLEIYGATNFTLRKIKYTFDTFITAEVHSKYNKKDLITRVLIIKEIRDRLTNFQFTIIAFLKIRILLFLIFFHWFVGDQNQAPLSFSPVST
jgi:Haemolymph juvenile hormone binding protein (JHBP)